MLLVLRIALQIVCLVSNRTGSRSWHQKQTLHQTTSLLGWPSPSSMPPAVPLSWSSTFHTSDLPIWNSCFQYILPSVWHLSISSIIINTWIFCVQVSQHISYKTQKVYLSGICLAHIEQGLPDPTKSPSLYLVCRGIHHQQGDHYRTRLPYTINLLQLLK